MPVKCIGQLWSWNDNFCYITCWLLPHSIGQKIENSIYLHSGGEPQQLSHKKIGHISFRTQELTSPRAFHHSAPSTPSTITVIDTTDEVESSSNSFKDAIKKSNHRWQKFTAFAECFSRLPPWKSRRWPNRLRPFECRIWVTSPMIWMTFYLVCVILRCVYDLM